MSYSDFTIDSAARILDLKIGDQIFVPEVQQVWIEPQEYSLEPIDRLLGILCWMVRPFDLS